MKNYPTAKSLYQWTRREWLSTSSRLHTPLSLTYKTPITRPDDVRVRSRKPLYSELYRSSAGTDRLTKPPSTTSVLAQYYISPSSVLHQY